jgi:hypothetical protein
VQRPQRPRLVTVLLAVMLSVQAAAPALGCAPDLAAEPSRLATGARLARQAEASYRLPPGIAAETALEYAYGIEVALHDWLDLTLAEGLAGEADRILALLQTYRPLYRDVTGLNVYFGDGRTRLAPVVLTQPQPVLLAANGTEALLHSSQFLAVISTALAGIAAIPPPDRTSAMQGFSATWLPLLASHLARWTDPAGGPFQNRGAGCALDRQPAATFLRAKLMARDRNQPAACSVLNDVDMWLVFMAVNLLAAVEKAPDWQAAMPAGLGDRLRDLMAAGSDFIQASLLPTVVIDWSGRPRLGAVIDLAGRRNDGEYRFAGYDGARFPEEADATVPPDLSWDLAHAARLPRLSERLAEAAPHHPTRIRFREISVRLANQFAYRMFEGDLDRPRFFNFTTGANGWYRVNYDGRSGFAYPPFAMSAGVLQTGFFRLARYNPDAGRVAQAVLAMLRTADEDTCAFARTWYGASFVRDRLPAPNGLFKPGGGELALPFVATLPPP